MFEFRFLDDNTNPDENIGPPESLDDDWLESKEVQMNLDCIKEILSRGSTSWFKCANNTSIKHIASNITSLLSDKVTVSPIFDAERNDSDLLTGVYEGIANTDLHFSGLKIWECTYDLANYITEDNLNLKDQKVLDLGCGTGIIGILAFVAGSSVYFQDYNEEILRYITTANVYLNSDDRSLDLCRFYAGDWKSFLEVTEIDFAAEDGKFDYIFTCETIYNPQNYRKLHAVFKQRLKKEGIIYLAAKTHYFGVGGGLRQFEDFMLKENVFNFSTCWKCSEGLQREILKITFKQST